MSMKQPTNTLEVFTATSEPIWVDITCLKAEGGTCHVGIGKGATKESAYKAAAKRLRKLADQADKLAAKTKKACPK